MKRVVRDRGSKPDSARASKLVLAVAVGEHREHEEVEPVVDGRVERAEDPGLVGVAAAALEEFFRFLAAIAAEVAVEKVNHRPQVTAFLDVDLEEIAQVIKRGRGEAEQALLLDARGLGVALGHDEATQCVAVFAGDHVPHRRADVVAKPMVRFGMGSARKMPQR
jgi:hypothetical protein